MSKLKIQLLVLISLTLIFNWFFWEEKLALNLVLFTLLLMGAILAFNPGSVRRRYVRITASGTLLCMGMVLIHNSGTAKFGLIASFIAFVGFVFQNDHRSLPYALWTVWANPICLIEKSAQIPLNFNPKNATLRKGMGILRISLFPLMVLFVFYLIFLSANPRFAEINFSMLNDLFYFLNHVFQDISLDRIVFTAMGFFLVVAFIFNAGYRYFADRDSNASEFLIRRRSTVREFHPTLALKTEYTTALLLIVLVNLLLLVINVIDISWIWFGFHVPENFNLSQFVHEGTYLLILSILLSMGIMFWYFRGNLSFYAGNKALKWASYAWIAQNVVLVISVGIRNYHYIAHHGLAYKRIGVIFFLILTLAGLYTLYRKIQSSHSVYRVIRINAWATYSLMLFLCLINWDIFIARYNLGHINSIEPDRAFLLSLSDKTLPLLDQNRELFGDIQHSPSREYSEPESYLDYRIHRFIENYENKSWLSWNLADKQAYDWFKKK